MNIKINLKYLIHLGLLLIISAVPKHLMAQTIKGQVFETVDDVELPAIGAFVHCTDESTGVVTDSNGYFNMPVCASSKTFTVEHITSKPAIIEIKPGKLNYKISLEPSAEMLKAATAVGKKQTYGMRSIDPKTTINLGEREFQKAACCNLSESFENAPAIDVNYGDAVTGTRQIKMLGLDGFYSMISREYMPSVRLLNSYYGMSFIPSAWVKGIQITKGAGSVVNGYESIAGQINIEMKKPFDSEKIMLDQFVSEAGRSETDFMYRHDISAKLATSLFVRTALYPVKQDRNGDGFLDNPTGNQFQVMNRWQFITDKTLEGEMSISYNKDTKNAGQQAYFESASGKVNNYGIGVDNEQFDIWAKLGKIFPEKPYQSFGSQYGYNQSKIRSTYGTDMNPFVYEAEARSIYANLLFQSIIGSTVHGYKVGTSILIDELTEVVGRGFNNRNYDRLESVVGAFAEYTFQPSEHISVVTGLRSDYNNLYGLSVTPRLHSKFVFNKEKTTLRASAGIGRRTSNIYGQNQQMFASSRSIEIIGSRPDGAYGLDQEVAFNNGMSIEHKMKWRLRPATLLLDFFHTSFSNEVVFDRETDSMVYFYNMQNGTRANSFQAQLDYQLFRRMEIRMAYRMFDVQTKYLHNTLQKPFVARHRAFLNLTQNTRSNWQYSATLQVYGEQRIPGQFRGITFLGNVFYQDLYSAPFVQLNMQISKKVNKSFEAFFGAENVLNYKQENPIAGANHPFSQAFDASLVWGPVFGRMMYGGFRWRFSDR